MSGRGRDWINGRLEIRPADAIDPVYGRTLREAVAAGVEVLAYRARVSLAGIALTDRVPVVCE